MDACTDLFNTVHILYFLQQYLLRSKIPYNLIDRNAMMDYMKLRHLIISDKKGAGTSANQTNGNFSRLRQIMETHSVHSAIVDRFPVQKIISPENFISLLYYFGLLTITGIDEEKKPFLKSLMKLSNACSMITLKKPMRKPGYLPLISADTKS